jgi:uncharacterized alpha-E superfamily protein
MLSRVADALFWTSRYLERAEHVTRLLDVWFHLELDLAKVGSAARERHWRSLAAILQQQLPAAGDGATREPIVRWLTFDLENPSSIMSCVSRARSNARSIRDTINSEIWRDLNKLYWRLCDPEFRSQAHESPHEFFQAVESGSYLIQGVCDATLDRGEGWQFIQLGKFLERADKTLRILDRQYQFLQEHTDPSERPLANVQWAAVLRGCRAFEAYQRLYVGRVEPERVVELLLLHPSFPRSVRFSLESIARALDVVGGPRPLGRAERLLGRVLADLKFIDLERALEEGLPKFLARVLADCVAVSVAVQEHYSPHL